MNGKRVAVLGGAGFLGSHLCERLLADGAASVVSRRQPHHRLGGEPPGPPGQRPLPPRGAGHLRAVRRGRPARLRLQPRLARLAHRLRAAAAGDAAGGLAGHRARARAGRGARARSSSRPPPRRSTAIRSCTPRSETTGATSNPIGPRSVYDEAKRYGEALVAAYRRTHGLQTRIVRIFNTYGPRMRLNDGRVVPGLRRPGARRRGLHRLRRRRARRAASATSRTWWTASSGWRSPSVQDPVNLGNPEEMTILQFAEAVRAAAGGGGRIVHRPLPKDDPQRRRPDITPRPGVAGLGATHHLVRRTAADHRLFPWRRRAERRGRSTREGPGHRRSRIHRQPRRATRSSTLATRCGRSTTSPAASARTSAPRSAWSSPTSARPRRRD